MLLKRKLQIFISSTYTDLVAERQAAVEAVLRAGHIPAGMELFAAGDRGQMDTIRRWIDESDVYMLILGARYGSIDTDTRKSYTQLEYEYALASGKRLFAVVLSDSAIDRKVTTHGRNVLEAEHSRALSDFRGVVMSKVCRLVDDDKDIKLAVHETILEFLREYSFDGWVSGKHLIEMDGLTQEITRLTRENSDLRAETKTVQFDRKIRETRSGEDFDAIEELLGDERITYKKDDGAQLDFTPLEWFIRMKTSFVSGISNTYKMDPFSNFLFFRVGPHLSMHGLVEDQKVTGVKWRTMKTTKKGNEFLIHFQKKTAAKQMTSGSAASAQARRKIMKKPPAE